MLESAISSKTKAIMAVNLLGNPNNFDRINELTENKGITLLEDNCESMGAKFKGQASIGFLYKIPIVAFLCSILFELLVTLISFILNLLVN